MTLMTSPLVKKTKKNYGTKRHSGWRDLRRRLKFPNLIVSLTRLGHVLEEYIGPFG